MSHSAEMQGDRPSSSTPADDQSPSGSFSKSSSAVDPSQWLDEHGDYLFNLAIGQLRNEHAAEEVVQETLLAGIAAQDSFRGDSTVRTWLTGIMHKKIADYIRRRVRDRRLVDDDRIARQLSHFFNEKGYWRIPVSGHHRTPNSTNERSEFWRVMRECSKKLSPGLADAFCLREVNGLPTEEICEILEVSPTNLSTMLYRARMLLRKCLEKNWFESPYRRRSRSVSSTTDPAGAGGEGRMNFLRRVWDNLIFILTANCDQATRLMSESFERRLTIVEYLALHGHLLSCKTGRRFRRQILAIRRCLREFEPNDEGRAYPPDEAISFRLPDEARERIRIRLDDELRNRPS